MGQIRHAQMLPRQTKRTLTGRWGLEDIANSWLQLLAVPQTADQLSMYTVAREYSRKGEKVVRGLSIVSGLCLTN